MYMISLPQLDDGLRKRLGSKVDRNTAIQQTRGGFLGASGGGQEASQQSHYSDYLAGTGYRAFARRTGHERVPSDSGGM